MKSAFTAALLVALAARGLAPAAEPGDPLPTFDETCFQSRLQSGYLALTDAQRMLEGIGENKIGLADKNKVVVKGLFRLRDWKPDDVVQFSIAHHGMPLRLFVWGEKEGVIIFLHPIGAAYRILQKPDDLLSKQDFHAAIGALVATDDRRDFRLPAGAYQVRYQDGAVVITKGDVRLMTVPLEGPAKSMYLQLPWGGALYELAVSHAGPAPDYLPEHRLVLDGTHPAQLPWNAKLPAGARFQKFDDGSVELSAEQTAELAMATLPGPAAGLYEVILRIDEAGSGTGIAFLDAKGEPLEGIAFEELPKGRFVFGFATPRESPRMGNEAADKLPVSHAGPHQWLRLVLTAGVARCWISGDGRHWGQVLESHDRMGSWRSIALFAWESGRAKQSGQSVRRIRLGSLQVRELEGLVDAAPSELLAKAAGADVAIQYDKNETLEDWWKRIASNMPAGASPTAWRYACVMRALAAPIRLDAAEAMLNRVVRERVEELPTAQAKIRLLEDAALIWQPGPWVSQKEMDIWNSVGRELLNTCTRAEFEQFQQAFMQASFAEPLEHTGPLYWDLVRDAMFLYYGERRTSELSRMVSMVTFWQANDSQVSGWPMGQQIDRLLTLLNVRPLHKLAHKRRSSVDIAAAIAPPLNRAADSILSELQSALDAKQYADAARILTSSNPPRDGGLVPAPEDDQLYVSFSVALRMLMARYGGFRDTLNQQVGPADQLKIDQCLARNDAAAVEVLALQYYGTTVSALPCRWLGDRALAAADFAQAVHWYEEGLRAAPPEEQPDLAARKRLASAMLGTLEGSPPGQPVTLGADKIAPDRFEQLVQRQLARARQAPALAMPVDELPTLQLKAPANIARDAFSSWNESAGRGYRREDMPGEFYDVDWTWRHLTLRAEEDGLFVFHRSRIMAFDVAGRKLRWTCSLGNSWSPSPARPLFTANHIYVCAALAPERCGVACLDRKTGRRLWLCDCDGAPVSDPISSRGRLFVFAMGRAFRQPTVPLSLVELQPDTGDIVSRQTITEMIEHVSLPGQCDVACTDDRLVATIAGNILCLDFQGRMLWLRQETPLSYQIDPGAIQQHSQPPILSGGRLYIQQPGSCVIECLDLETGDRCWRRGVVGLRSICELDRDRLLARTDWGLVVLNMETGNVLWQRALAGMLAINARTTTGSILIARQPISGDKPQVEFNWLDTATGRLLGHSAIALSENRPVKFGPLAVRGDRAWAAIGYGPKDDSPTAENNKHIVELRFSEPIVESEEW